MSFYDEFGKICAVVVTYNIGNNYLMNFKSLYSQVDKIIIVDNNSDSNTIIMLKIIERTYKEKVEIVYNCTNKGLAYAQNQGILKAGNIYDWIFLLDHDSRLNEDMINIMKNYYLSLSIPEREKLAILAPNIFDLNINEYNKYIISYKKFFFKRTRCEKQFLNVLCVIASGSLIKSSVLHEIGTMRENFFIDSIDTEFCLRVKKYKYNIVLLKEAVLYHCLGERVKYKVLNMNFIPTNHNPKRRYFIYRNRIKVWKEYAFIIPSYILFEMLATGYDFLRILLFEKERYAKIKQIAKGIWDGLVS